MIDCNHKKSAISSNSWQNLWLITEKPQGMRLDVYLSTEQPSFKEKLIIILTLIDLIKEIHQCDVIHRNLTPSKIFIQPITSDDGENGFRLQIIDFDYAHVSPNEIQKTNSSTGPLQSGGSITNHFYLPVQFQLVTLNSDDIDEEKESKELERQSFGIDTSSICAILFWMITYHEPKLARNSDGKAPHHMSENKQLIDDTLMVSISK